MSDRLNDQAQHRLQKLLRLKQTNNDPYLVTKTSLTHSSKSFQVEFEKCAEEELKKKTTVSLAGRIIAIRQTFLIIQDFDGQVQLYINKKIHPKLFDYFNEFVDIGDQIVVSGKPMLTKTKVLTLAVEEMKIIAKCLLVPPEKWHGLTDIETRASKRFLDLTYNLAMRDVFLKRTKIIKSIRSFLDQNGFIEVETPTLQAVLGGANAKPFKTHYNVLKADFYLRIANEIALKKLIIGGFNKVYEMGKMFRNEGVDTTHNPEFTSIEIYQAYADFEVMLVLVEKMIQSLCESLNQFSFNWNNKTINLKTPFHKITMVELIKKVTGIDFNSVKDDQSAILLAEKHHVKLAKHQQNKQHIINLFFEQFCEQTLIEPTFVTHYPKAVSPLAKQDPSNPEFTQRFELFINGKEIANAYSELNDPLEQRKRFEQQLEEKQLGNDETSELDESFLEALSFGMVNTAGLGIGIDRLVMLLCECNSIRDVVFFPQLREHK
ncbi:lysine--tRNA ligase [Mycoplasmoides genitalium]